MKVALINNFPPYSGTGRVPYALYREFRNNPAFGIAADLYCTHYLEKEDLTLEENQTVKFMHRFPYKKNETLSRLLIYFADPFRVPRRYQLYHLGNHMLGNYLYFLSPAVVTVHDLLQFKYEQALGSSLSSRVYNTLLQASLKALPRAKRIICVSDWTRREVRKRFPQAEDKTITIHNGLDHQLYRPGDRGTARRRLNLPPAKKIILNVGAETKRKNMPMLFKTAAALLKEGLDLYLLRVGEKTAAAAGLIRELGMESRVGYCGNVREALMPDYYRAADLLLLPSLDEGFGFPLLEALACGLPTVASNVGPLPEIGGAAALYSEPTNLEGFVAAAKKIFGEAPDSAGRRREAAIRQAGNFSWEKNARETAAVYETILNKPQ